MENDIKALYIIANAGFANDVVNIARDAGANGTTVFNARGESMQHEPILGITVDSEKEIILSLTDGQTAERVMEAIKEQAGIETPAHCICFVLPVDKTFGLSGFDSQSEK